MISGHSPKEGAAPTFKRGFGFHALAAWCANTGDTLAMLLRHGSAGSNTIADHLRVLPRRYDGSDLAPGTAGRAICSDGRGDDGPSSSSPAYELRYRFLALSAVSHRLTHLGR